MGSFSAAGRPCFANIQASAGIFGLTIALDPGHELYEPARSFWPDEITLPEALSRTLRQAGVRTKGQSGVERIVLTDLRAGGPSDGRTTPPNGIIRRGPDDGEFSRLEITGDLHRWIRGNDPDPEGSAQDAVADLATLILGTPLPIVERPPSPVSSVAAAMNRR